MAGIRTRTTIKSFWFGFVLLLVVGGAFSLIGASLLRSNLDLVRSGTHTKGTVVEMVKHTSSKSTTYEVVIEYVTSAGERIRSGTSVGSNAQAYRAGDAVDIIYPESNPRRFLLDKFSEKYGFPAIFLLAGVVCLIIDVVQTVRKVVRSSRPNTSSVAPT